MSNTRTVSMKPNLGIGNFFLIFRTKTHSIFFRSFLKGDELLQMKNIK